LVASEVFPAASFAFRFRVSAPWPYLSTSIVVETGGALH
jgi:hypothetical protein